MTEEDQLWQEFHQVVNMTSRELSDWLRTQDASEDAEAMPDQAGQPTGRQVLHVLGRRHRDLTEDDRRVMRKVVDRVRAQRREDLEPAARPGSWRPRPMVEGHDPTHPAP